MTRYVFQEIAIKATKRWKDSATGKPRSQTRKFFQTLNPFNRDSTGDIKTREQIYAEIKAERDTWLASKE